MANWFYGKDNAQHGPISELEIRNLISTGKIDSSTIIWREGMPDWKALQEVQEFQAGSSLELNSPYSPPSTENTVAYHSQAMPTSGLAIASMICGIIGIIASCMYMGFFFGIPAVICGHISLKKIKLSNSPIQGRGMAITGLITGYLSIIVSLCIIGFLVFMFTLTSNTTTI